MSLQAIAGTAFQRLNPNQPTVFTAAQTAALESARKDGTATPAPGSAEANAKKINNSLELLKRYIPTELLAIYLPVVAIVSEEFKPDASLYLLWNYLGFLAATPIVIYALYVANAAEAKAQLGWHNLPFIELLLGTAAFTVWGAAVPTVFEGQQWLIGIFALISSVALPLAETLMRKLSSTA